MTRDSDRLGVPGRQFARWAGAAVVVVMLHAAAAAYSLMHWKEPVEPDDPEGAVVIELAPLPVAAESTTPDLAPGPLAEETPPDTPPVQPEELKKTEDTPKVEESPLAPEPEVILPKPEPVVEKEPEKLPEAKPVEAEPAPPVETTNVPLTTAPPKIEAPPAPAAAPRMAMTPQQSKARATWQKELVTHVNRFKRYPAEARREKTEGEVDLEFTMDRQGRIVSSHVAKSSGSPTLDAEAINVVARASPLPVPPSDMAGETFTLLLPIKFRFK